MSVQMNQYLGFGYFLPYDEAMVALKKKYSEEELDELMDTYHDSAFKELLEVKGCSMIVDGMDGKYIFFGIVQMKSTVYEPLESLMIEVPKPKARKNLNGQILEIFGTDFNIKPNLHLLTHYR